MSDDWMIGLQTSTLANVVPYAVLSQNS